MGLMGHAESLAYNLEGPNGNVNPPRIKRDDCYKRIKTVTFRDLTEEKA